MCCPLRVFVFFDVLLNFFFVCRREILLEGMLGKLEFYTMFNQCCVCVCAFIDNCDVCRKPDENFMKNTSNGRYVVWTISEFVIVATLFIQFTITASA
jgi:hypothetical protein